MKGSWEGIAGRVVNVDVHGEFVCCGWMQCSCSRRDVLGWLFMVMKYPLFQLNALLEQSGCFNCYMFCSLHQSIHSSFKLCCEILLLLNVAESGMDCLLCGRLWSTQC